MNKIRVGIVEDDPGWMKAMTSFIDRQDDMMVAGKAVSKDEAIRMAQDVSLDVILMDINLHENKRDGIIAALEILEKHNTKIIMLTSMNDEEIIKDSFAAGAVNYVYKEDHHKIPEIIRSVLIENSSMNVLLKEYSRLKKEEQISELTPAEKEVYRLLEQGYSRSEIEKKLDKSQNTIKSQIKGILDKLNAKSTKEAILKVHKKLIKGKDF